MRERLIALRVRREQLIARAAAERGALAEVLARTDPVSGWVGLGAAALAALVRRPLWIAAAAGALIALRPKRALKWLASGWSLWQIYRQASESWRRLSPLLATQPARRSQR